MDFTGRKEAGVKIGTVYLNDGGKVFEQLSIFDFLEEKPEAGQKEKPQGSILSDYAFLYTSTATGKNSGIHFMMTKEDAMKWCDSDLSHGSIMGNEWAYFWTTVQNFIACHWGTHKPTLDFRKARDNGIYDEKIAALGLKKYGFEEIRDILKPLGVEVVLY